MQWYLVRIHRHFNPLPPYGGRLVKRLVSDLMQEISIHSLRMEGDVSQFCTESVVLVISIHSLRMEGDFLSCDFPPSQSIFQSTPSVWRETLTILWRLLRLHISIHSLRMEGDALD